MQHEMYALIWAISYDVLSFGQWIPNTEMSTANNQCLRRRGA